MRKVVTALLAGVAIVSVTMFAMAQPPDGPRGPGRGPEGRGGPGGRGPGGPPPNPILEALDANGDHEISAEEIDNAVSALRKLDQNGDGKLTRDEVRPFGPGQRGGRSPQGRGFGAREDRPEGVGGPGPGGGRDATEFVERIRGFDLNKDGKVSKDELPERMLRILDRHDANEDGALDQAELETAGAQLGRAREGGRGGPGLRGRLDGPPSPERLVERAMTFDADKDGKLSRDELMQFAKEVTNRVPLAEGGGFRRGFGGGGGGERGQRPQRSAPGESE